MSRGYASFAAPRRRASPWKRSRSFCHWIGPGTGRGSGCWPARASKRWRVKPGSLRRRARGCSGCSAPAAAPTAAPARSSRLSVPTPSHSPIGGSAMEAKYDIIASNYAELRKPDPRIARIIARALGPAQAILNVGAGTGSYEPAGRSVTAVEPSRQMIAKRGPMAARVVEASAGALPFADKSFDASMAILTIHHWSDKEAGLREMRRVTRGPIVLLTFDPAQRPWLTDYLPDLVALDDVQMPAMSDYGR